MLVGHTRDLEMRLLKPLAEIVFWMGLWIGVPAALLYPVALWLTKRTHISADTLGQTYFYAVAALWLPTGFLVDWTYRRFFRRNHAKVQPELKEPRS